MHPTAHLTRRLRIGVVTLLILGAVAAACSDSPTAPAREVAGCYRLETRDWVGDRAEFGAFPDTIRLLESLGVSALENGRSIVRAWPDSMRTYYQWSWWEVRSPDTLMIVFSTGFTGAELQLRPAGGMYDGTLTTFVDYQSSAPAWARATAHPVACGA